MRESIRHVPIWIEFETNTRQSFQCFQVQFEAYVIFVNDIALITQTSVALGVLKALLEDYILSPRQIMCVETGLRVLQPRLPWYPVFVV